MKNTAKRVRPQDFGKVFTSVVCRRPKCAVLAGMENPDIHPKCAPQITEAKKKNVLKLFLGIRTTLFHLVGLFFWFLLEFFFLSLSENY